MKTKIVLATAIAGMLCINPLPEAHAEIAVQIRVGDPRGPSFVIESWPNFIYLPEQGFSVAEHGPYDIIFYRNFYYVYHNGYWYRARQNRGPWIIVKENHLPPDIRRHRWEEIRRVREIEYRKRDRERQEYREHRMDRERRPQPGQPEPPQQRIDGRPQPGPAEPRKQGKKEGEKEERNRDDRDRQRQER